MVRTNVETSGLFLGGYEARIWADDHSARGTGVGNTKEEAIEKAIIDYKINK